jgi:hypothetical protein
MVQRGASLLRLPTFWPDNTEARFAVVVIVVTQFHLLHINDAHEQFHHVSNLLTKSLGTMLDPAPSLIYRVTPVIPTSRIASVLLISLSTFSGLSFCSRWPLLDAVNLQSFSLR